MGIYENTTPNVIRDVLIWGFHGCAARQSLTRGYVSYIVIYRT